MPVCTYCSKEFPRLTSDHVFARSYYPASTAADVERWTVLACADCNNQYSRLDEIVLLRLAACLNPKHPAAAGIWETARRSLDPNEARNERDRRARAKKREFPQDLQIFQSRPEVGVLPSFDKNWEQGLRTRIFVLADDLDRLVRKWVLGIHYKTLGRMIPDASEIDVFHIDERVAEARLLRDVLKRSTTHHRDPGIRITQAIGSDTTEIMTVYRFLIWDQFAVYASLREQAQQA